MPDGPIYLSNGKNTAEPHCPSCGRKNDGFTAASHRDGAVLPEDGDASICAYCGVLCVFTADGGLRFPTVDETAKIMQDPRIRAILARSPILPPHAP